MKKFNLALIAALFAFSPLLRAQEPAANPYDLLSRVLVPIASVFSPEAKQHGLSATLVLEEMTDLPSDLVGARVELALQPPDRVLIRGPYNGQMVTVCRVGQQVWITPNSPPFDVLGNPPGQPSKEKRKKLGPMTLPFPPQQLALLPILLQVRDAGTDHGLRVLEAGLMPQLAQNLGVEEWSVRLSLNATGQPARIRVQGPGWSIAVRVERLEYSTELPPATWEPIGNAVRLNAQQIRQWIDAIGLQMESHRPKS